MSKMMRGEEAARWRARNLRENADYRLKPGDRFMDCFWVWNTIVKLDQIPDERLTIEDHGSITTVRDDGEEEHYARYNWQENFRVERS
jgi:hypothetical protein